MHAIQEVKLQFDPAKNEDEEIREIFKDSTATILWCSIKSGHVTSQYFNKNVLEVAKKYNKTHTRDYDTFLDIVSKLLVFGKVTVNQTIMQCDQKIDHEFWGDVFRSVIGQRHFKWEVV